MSVTTAPPQRLPPQPPPPRAPAPPPVEPPEEARTKRLVLRLLLGCLIVLLCSAGVGATIVLEQVQSLQDALNQNAALNLPGGTLAPTGWGDPETLLLVGDDQRTLTGAFKYYSQPVLPHSNEMLLVRIDPSKPYISMLSIPRELMVTINTPTQGLVTTRFNYAYTAGGIPLLVSTIKQVLGVSVNHVMVVTFARFQRAVNEMGCVYSTVDRRYYHVNTPGTEQYQEVNLQPGYQNLCGKQALEFVSYRHGDTSLVRDARDQSFLLDVKKQYGSALVGSIGKFERIFGRAVVTDAGLHSKTQLLNLIGTLISSAGRRVRQVPFQVDLSPTDPTAVACNCVTASSQQIGASVHAWLYGGSPIPKKNTAAVAHAVHSRKGVAQLPLVPISSAEIAQARSQAARLPFPYELPRVQDRGGNGTPVYYRDYLIHTAGKTTYPIYVQVFSGGQLGQYYDVQGTTWTGAPVLQNPDQTVTVGGRTYDLYYQGRRLKMVAWQEHGAAYWVRNSLNDALPNSELLAIAEQTQTVPAVGPGTTGHVRLRGVKIPPRVIAPATSDLRQMIGSIGGLLTLLVVPLFALPLLRRRRALTELRARLTANTQLEARLNAAVAGAAVTLPPPRSEEAPRWYTEASQYVTAGRRVPRRLLRALAAVALAAVVAFAIVSLTGGSTTHRSTTTAKALSTGPPTIPVAVLNATPGTGAAAKLAQQLRPLGVKVSAITNVVESRSHGVWILYAAGERAQAAKLAALLARRSPTIAPIDQAAETAAGGAGVAVVIT